ncbi:hypothetical protein NKK52_29945 [Mesorhizobium sp. C277A]|uniref:hypothetical protein n=1 Tax=Mesorhizobium sp. C277A TaxID=2956827 RepID=UPI0004CE338E|nr:hypothetical protein [Mesorhizobium sp. LSJC277A00]
MRDDRIVKMCVAVATGLCDAAINYVWNAAVVELRVKVRRFGINVVPQILDDKSFDEDTLLDLKDAELLDLCRKLNLIGDDGFFFLDQCRATRNSFFILAPEGVERRSKRVYIDMVVERGEPFLLPQPCGCVRGPTTGTCEPDSVSGACVAVPRSPWSPALVPPTLLPVVRLCSSASRHVVCFSDMC